MTIFDSIRKFFSPPAPPEPRRKFPIGSYILHIPEFIDVLELGRVTHYDNFGHPVTNKFIGIGYCIPFSPLALDTLMKLSPVERLAIFSQYLLPIHDLDRTLNFETLDRERITEDLLEQANEWYNSQPINQIEIIADTIKEPQSPNKPPRKKRLKKTATKKVNTPKRIPIVNSEPEL